MDIKNIFNELFNKITYKLLPCNVSIYNNIFTIIKNDVYFYGKQINNEIVLTITNNYNINKVFYISNNTGFNKVIDYINTLK